MLKQIDDSLETTAGGSGWRVRKEPGSPGGPVLGPLPVALPVSRHWLITRLGHRGSTTCAEAECIEARVRHRACPSGVVHPQATSRQHGHRLAASGAAGTGELLRGMAADLSPSMDVDQAVVPTRSAAVGKNGPRPR
jgi:hypothetical protein